MAAVLGLPSNAFFSFLECTYAFPGQMGGIIPPASSGSTVGSLPSVACPKDLSVRDCWRHPESMPEAPLFAPLEAKDRENAQ